MSRFKIVLFGLAAFLLLPTAASAFKVEIIIDNDELYSAAKRSFHQGKLEEAAYYYSEAIRRHALSDQATVVAHSDLCVTLLFLERFDEAVAQCKVALDLMPNRWETLNNLGTVYLVRGDYGSAIAAYERALGMKPNSHILRSNKQLAIRRAKEAATDDPAVKAKKTDSLKGASGSGF